MGILTTNIHYYVLYVKNFHKTINQTWWLAVLVYAWYAGAVFVGRYWAQQGQLHQALFYLIGGMLIFNPIFRNKGVDAQATKMTSYDMNSRGYELV